jgi:hypothetical protein
MRAGAGSRARNSFRHRSAGGRDGIDSGGDRNAAIARTAKPCRPRPTGLCAPGAFGLRCRMRLIPALCLFTLLSACGSDRRSAPGTADPPALYAGETPEMRALIVEYAEVHDIPEALLHRVIQRESDYRPRVRNGPYWGLMQILPETAAQMGHSGPPKALLDTETNLEYAGRYLKGAWLVADGDIDAAVKWYARGYYDAARDRCLLVETGLRDREVARQCRA